MEFGALGLELTQQGLGQLQIQPIVLRGGVGERQCRLRRGVHFLLGTCGLGFMAFDLEFSASEYFGLPRRLVRFLCLAFEGARRVQVWCRDILGPRLSVFLKPQH